MDQYSAASGLDQFIENMLWQKFNPQKIFDKLKALVKFRGDDISDENLLIWVEKFKNLGWKNKDIFPRIEAMFYKKGTKEKLRFSDFIYEDDYSMINYEIVKIEAQNLLEKYFKNQRILPQSNIPSP